MEEELDFVFCSYCQKKESVWCCGRCATPYCSKSCQKHDWVEGFHKKHCSGRAIILQENIGTNLKDFIVASYVFDYKKARRLRADLKEIYKKYCQYQNAAGKVCEPLPQFNPPKNKAERKVYISAMEKTIAHFKSATATLVASIH